MFILSNSWTGMWFVSYIPSQVMFPLGTIVSHAAHGVNLFEKILISFIVFSCTYFCMWKKSERELSDDESEQRVGCSRNSLDILRRISLILLVGTTFYLLGPQRQEFAHTFAIWHLINKYFAKRPHQQFFSHYIWIKQYFITVLLHYSFYFGILLPFMKFHRNTSSFNPFPGFLPLLIVRKKSIFFSA